MCPVFSGRPSSALSVQVETRDAPRDAVGKRPPVSAPVKSSLFHYREVAWLFACDISPNAGDSADSTSKGRRHRCDAAGFSSRRRSISVEHSRIVGQVVCELTSIVGREAVLPAWF